MDMLESVELDVGDLGKGARREELLSEHDVLVIGRRTRTSSRLGVWRRWVATRAVQIAGTDRCVTRTCLQDTSFPHVLAGCSHRGSVLPVAPLAAAPRPIEARGKPRPSSSSNESSACPVQSAVCLAPAFESNRMLARSARRCSGALAHARVTHRQPSCAQRVRGGRTVDNRLSVFAVRVS